MRSLELMKQRKTAKRYLDKKIDEKTFTQLLEVLRLAPTSVNLQAGKFLVGSSEKAKATFALGLHSANVQRVKNASHFILFCRPLEVTKEHFDAVVKSEFEAKRIVEITPTIDASRRAYTKMHEEVGDLKYWLTHQLYIALGCLLIACEDLGIAATAIEGLDKDKMDELFNLKEKGLACEFAVCLGYRDEVADSNYQKPKARLSIKQKVEYLD